MSRRPPHAHPLRGVAASVAVSGHDKNLTDRPDFSRNRQDSRPGSRHISQIGGQPRPGGVSFRVTLNPNRS